MEEKGYLLASGEVGGNEDKEEEREDHTTRTEGLPDFLVNSYMTYGLKKVEPPTKKLKNGRD